MQTTKAGQGGKITKQSRDTNQNALVLGSFLSQLHFPFSEIYGLVSIDFD